MGYESSFFIVYTFDPIPNRAYLLLSPDSVKVPVPVIRSRHM